MTITRRNALVGLAASLGAAAPIPKLLLPAPTGPIALGRYYLPYWRDPVWQDAFCWLDFWPFLKAYRWQYDDQTYDYALISCVENGRLFQVIPIGRGPDAEIGVFEIWGDGHRIPGTPDRYANPLAGAARFAATWAFKLALQRQRFHKGAVYIAFDPGNPLPPVLTDAPPLIIHPWLSLSPFRDMEEDEEDKDDDDGFEEGVAEAVEYEGVHSA
jgi:hypothetical protein